MAKHLRTHRPADAEPALDSEAATLRDLAHRCHAAAKEETGRGRELLESAGSVGSIMAERCTADPAEPGLQRRCDLAAELIRQLLALVTRTVHSKARLTQYSASARWADAEDAHTRLQEVAAG